MKRVIVLSLVLVAAVGVALALGASSRAGAEDSYVTKQRQFIQVDVGKKGFSIGDSFIFSERLLQAEKPVGYDHIICTHVADWPRSAEHCSGTVTLGRDQIMLEGDARRGPFTVAIVGGTGRYAGARGSANIVSQGSRGTLAIHLQ